MGGIFRLPEGCPCAIIGEVSLWIVPSKHPGLEDVAMTEFSEQLKMAITKSGVPVARIARQSGLSQSMLYKIQSGARLPDSLETLERMTSAMACSLPQRQELLRSYRIARVGPVRYRCFQEMRQMFSAMARSAPLPKTGDVAHEMEVPSVITGAGNIDLVMQYLLEKETLRPNGRIRLMLPLNFGYCVGYLSQALANCHPEFGMVEHLFYLQSTQTDEAMYYNVTAMGEVLPRIVTMPRYCARYSYLTDPGVGTVPFPYLVITSDGVMQIGMKGQKAVFLGDPAVRDRFIDSFEETAKQFQPMVEVGAPSMEMYFRIWANVTGPILEETIRAVCIATAPCILSSLPRELSLKYLPKEMMRPEMLEISRQFYEKATEGGCVSFFTEEGLRHLLETGQIVEMPGNFVPRGERQDILLALKIFIQRCKEGINVPCLFRENLFQGVGQFAMSQRGGSLLTLFEHTPGMACANITESSLSRLVSEYAEAAEMVGDVYSPAESIEIMERIVSSFQ